MLTQPYYGAETFGLHAIGARALAQPAAIELVDQVRQQPIALAMFALGLVLLAVSGLSTAFAWSRAHAGAIGGAGWPLGVLTALLAPQFYLPPAGRVAYGLLFLAAAAVFVVAVLRVLRPDADRARQPAAG